LSKFKREDHCFIPTLKDHKASYLRFKVFDIVDYDWVLLLDADMIVSGLTPNPFEMFLPDQFCAATNEPSESFQLLEQEVRKEYWEKYKEKYNLPAYNDSKLDGYIFINTGTMLVSRKHHEQILRRGWEIAIENKWTKWPEQTPLNFAIVEAILNKKINFKLLNTMWNQRATFNDGLDPKYMSAYIYHFAGCDKNLASKVNWWAWQPGLLYREQLGTFLNSLWLVGEGAEIGVWRAFFSETILSRWHGKKLYLIDPYTEYNSYTHNMSWDNTAHKKNYAIAVESMEKQFPGRHEFIIKFSADAANMFKDGQLDFVYIDGNHSYKFVKEDLQLWVPKVKIGGLVSGHDFINLEKKGFGVKRAVMEFMAERQETLYVDRSKWPTWYFIKKE